MTDRIATSRPINKTAALVTGKGVHWEPRKELIKPWDAWRDTPLPIAPMPKLSPFQVGFKVCRLTVIGYGGKTNKSGRWVVRCTCGMYGHQRAKFLMSWNAKSRAMCPRCDHLSQMQQGHFSKGQP